MDDGSGQVTSNKSHRISNQQSNVYDLIIISNLIAYERYQSVSKAARSYGQPLEMVSILHIAILSWLLVLFLHSIWTLTIIINFVHFTIVRITFNNPFPFLIFQVSASFIDVQLKNPTVRNGVSRVLIHVTSFIWLYSNNRDEKWRCSSSKCAVGNFQHIYDYPKMNNSQRTRRIFGIYLRNVTHSFILAWVSKKR